MLKRTLLATAVAAMVLAAWATHAGAAHSRMSALPDTTLWAWQRPEKLTYIDPHRSAVAVLVETITLPAKFEPRNQPISAPDRTDYIAVIRIQGTPAEPPDPNMIAGRIAHYADNPHTRAMQIDFDATVSQRAFYRALLTEVRKRLPNDMPLSITALVSWCEGDDWIANLPVDEAVPMYFRMGVDQRNIRRDHMDVRNLREPLCRSSVGVSLDEPWPRFDSDVRVYAFAPAPWTESDYRRTLERLAR
ncbi:MAG TPA: DUF3142 domain-containing protein [Candidatus Koribacter sp.]|jgi:hypothetical protein